MHINISGNAVDPRSEAAGRGHGGGREWGKAVASYCASRRSSRPSDRLGGLVEPTLSDFV